MRISVITVTYNSLESLKRTFFSVISQDYEDLEYIIIDGNSSDGSRQWLQDCSRFLNDRITFSYISEADRGIYDAMNKGIQLASGDYCLFLNSADVFVNPNVISRVAETISLNDMPDVIYGDIIRRGKVVVAEKVRNCHRMYYCHQACFTSRQCLLDFPFDTKYRISADFKQSKLLFRAGKRFLHVNQVIAEYDTSGISSRNRSKSFRENIRIVRELDDFRNRLQLMPHLIFPYIMCRLRGK